MTDDKINPSRIKYNYGQWVIQTLTLQQITYLYCDIGKTCTCIISISTAEY